MQRKITIGTTYYNNPDNLKGFLKNHLEYCDEFLIVDDGSEIPMDKHLPKDERIKAFKVKKDYGFNSHGCRNLIMKQTSNEWNILLDIDRYFVDAQYSFNTLKQRPLKNNVLYKFMAFTEWASKSDSAHESVNDFLIHKDYFFSAGGYDEELMGYRTGDREYFYQLEHFGHKRVLYDIEIMLCRKPSTTLHSNEKSKFDKKQKLDWATQKLIYDRIKSPQKVKPILTFEWERIV
jgi:hypothetical protein